MFFPSSKGYSFSNSTKLGFCNISIKHLRIFILLKQIRMEPIIVERIFSKPISQVWKAITDKTEMKQWYFDLAEFKPEVGFKFKFMGGTEENQYLHICEVSEV